MQLDVTSPFDIASVAQNWGDVTLLVNNAGISTGTSLLSDDVLAGARRDFETNVFGSMAMN